MAHVDEVINEILRDASGGFGFGQGGRFGPQFGTLIVPVANGSELRTKRQEPIRRYALSREVLQSLVASDSWPKFLNFIKQTGGALVSFLFEDPSDKSTLPDHATNPATFTGSWPTAPKLAANFSAGDTVQLVKSYSATSKLPPYERIITRPKPGTVAVLWDDEVKVEGVDYSVAYDTGLITLLTEPAEPGPVLYADCQFYVPVRFGEGTDEWLQASVGAGPESIASLPNIEFEEVLNFAQGTEARFGGGARVLSMGADVNLAIGDDVFQVISSPVLGTELRLPNPNPTGPVDQAPLPLGGPYFVIRNAASNSVDLMSEGVLKRTLAPGDWVEVIAVEASPGPRDWLVLA